MLDVDDNKGAETDTDTTDVESTSSGEFGMSVPSSDAVQENGEIKLNPASLKGLFDPIEDELVGNHQKTSYLTNLFGDIDDNPVHEEAESIIFNREGSFSSQISDQVSNSGDSEISSNSENFISNVENERLKKCIAILKGVSDFVFDEVEIEESQKSEARKNDERKYKNLKDSINKLISKYDDRISKYGTNLEKYSNFIDGINGFDKRITSENIIKLSETLNPEKENSYLVRKAMKIRRSVMGFAAGFTVKNKDISEYNKLNKDQKKKIELLKELVELEKNKDISPEDKQRKYDEVNSAFVALDAKSRRREKREAFRILAKQIHKKKLFSYDTVKQFSDKVLHPYSKITKRQDLTTSEKAVKIGVKIAEKSFQGGKFIVEKAAENALDSARFMSSNSVFQPAASVVRGSMTIVNAMEYLTLEAMACSEKDPEIKEKLRNQAQVKFQNLGYQGERFIRAAASTVGIALLDTAMIATVGGISAPAAVGISAGEHFFKGVLMASQVADSMQTCRDGINKINEGIENVNEQAGKLTPEETRLRDRRGAVMINPSDANSNTRSNQTFWSIYRKKQQNMPSH